MEHHDREIMWEDPTHYLPYIKQKWVLYLRMSERLATSIQDLSAVDEELIDLHGVGILDGYTYEPQSWYYSWL